MIKQTKTTSTNFVDSQLRMLSERIDRSLQIGELSTNDLLFSKVSEMVRDFFRRLRSPATNGITFSEREFLNPNKQSKLTLAINDDISASYERILDAQQDIQFKSNKFFTLIRSIQEKISRASTVVANMQQLGYSNRFTVGDTFTSSNRFDPNAAIIGERLFQNENAGLLTLPRKSTEDIIPVNSTILDSSNGFIVDGFPLENLFDKNADTWFDYRRVTNDINNEESLILDLLITLKLPTIVNVIQFNPMNQNDKSFPIIQSIETSIDGKIYTDIRRSLPSFITKDEDVSLFTLGPIGFRNQSISEFILTPRIVKFIKIKIKQSKKERTETGVFVQTIAIRDIDIFKVQYQESGEFVSNAFSLPFQPRKVLLEERLADTEPLTSISYQLSFDGGSQWFDVVAQEPIEINTGSSNSLDVSSVLNEVRVRITGARNKEKFTGLAAPLASTIKSLTQRLPIRQTPATTALIGVPIEGTLKVLKPLAAIGFKQSSTIISNAPGEDSYRVFLPLKVKRFEETIRVEGKKWTRVSNFDNTGPDDSYYKINYSTNEVIFGDNVKGHVPTGKVSLDIKKENVVIPDTSPYIIKLKYAHDISRERIKIESYDRPRRIKNEILANGTKEFQLINFPIVKSIYTTEDIPASSKSFFLENIADITDVIDFSDKVRFATLVSTTPAVAGEYKLERLTSDKLSPTKVTVFTATHDKNPGQVSFNAIARITNIESTYSPDIWNKSRLEIYSPTFSDTSVFTNEKEFLDGLSELTQAGDFSINYEDGIIYAFSEVLQTGLTIIDYTAQNVRELTWRFTENTDELIIEDNSVLVNQNDMMPITVEQDSIKYFVLFKDSRFIWLPHKNQYVSSPNQEYTTAGLTIQDSPLQNNGIDFVFVPSSDFIRGQVLPAGKIRVQLPHASIVKNSIRFLFVSDNINAVDDRIVVKSPTGEIQVLQKPVKDVYGNSLLGSNIGILTQRDLDKTTIIREVEFFDGKKELERNSDYSVDYENGVLYTKIAIPKYTIIQYKFADIRVSYIASTELAEGKDFDIDFDTLQLTINSIDTTLETDTRDLLVQYNIIQDFAEDPAKIVNFYSPILYGYSIRLIK